MSILYGLETILAANHGYKTVAAAHLAPNNPNAPDTIVFVPDALLNGVATPALVVDTGSVYVAYFGTTLSGAALAGTGTVTTPPGGGPGVLSVTTAYNGLQRNARDMLNLSSAITSSVPDPDATAAMMDLLNFRWARAQLVVNGISNVPGWKNLASAMVARGMTQPSPKMIGLAMVYRNDNTTPAQNIPPAIEGFLAGLLKIWEGGNEINNQATGTGSHPLAGVNGNPYDPTLQYSTDALWPGNQRAMAQFMADARKANSNIAGLQILAASESAEDEVVMRTAVLLSDIIDGGSVHEYAGSGFPPGFPFGQSSSIGNFPNRAIWTLTSQGFLGRSMNWTSEAGAATNAGGNYSITGVSQAKYFLAQAFEAFAFGMAGCSFYQIEDGQAPYTGDVEGAFGIFRKKPSFSTLTAAATAATTTLTVANGSAFPGGGGLLALVDQATGNTREALTLTAVSGNTLTVTRGQQGSTAAAFGVGDVVAYLPHSTDAVLTPLALVQSLILQKAGDGTKGVLAPKPTVGAMRKWQDAMSLGLSFQDPRNANDTGAFMPGAEPRALVVSGIDRPDVVGGSWLQFDRSDGSGGIVITNSGQIVDNGGTDVTPPDDPITIDLGVTQTNIRRIDPMDATVTAAATPVAYASSRTIAATLKGYPLIFSWDAPANYSKTAGDARLATATPTGFSSFQAGISNEAYALNYSGTRPDADTIILGPKPGQQWTLGNFALIMVSTGTEYGGGLDTAAVAGSTIKLGPFSLPGSDLVQVAFFVPIQFNNQKTFIVTGVGTWASALIREVAPFKDYGATFALCTVSATQIVAPVGAIPAGALGYLSLELHDETGGDTVSTPTDTSVVIDLGLQIVGGGGTTHLFQAIGCTVAAGRAAGPVTFPVNNVSQNANVPTALTVWVSNVAQTQAPAAPSITAVAGTLTGQIQVGITPNLSAGTSIRSYDIVATPPSGPAVIAKTTATTYALQGVPGVAYSVGVQANNSFGPSALSAAVNVTAPVLHYLDTGANGQGIATSAVSPGAFNTQRSFTMLHSPLQNRKYDLLQHVSGSNSFYYYIENNTHQVYYVNASGVGGGVSAPVTNRAGANAGRLTVSAAGSFQFYDSIDGGATFQALGAAVAASAPMIYSAPIQIGGSSASVDWAVQRVTFVSDGTTALDVDFTTLTTGQTAITASVGGSISLSGGASIT
jgi:hypothetical protein